MVNECLLAKWWWRYGSEDRSLWKSILISKYGSASGKWLPFTEDGQQRSKIWGDILHMAVSNTQLYSFYVANCEIQVGNGTRIRFLENHWIGEKCFKEEHLRLFELSLEQEVPLSHLVERKRITSRWDLKFRRRLRVWEELEVVRLMDKLNSNTPCLTEKADALVWKASSNGMFSTAAAYNKLTSGQKKKYPENPPTKSQKIDVKENDIGSLERDPGLRIQIWDYHVNQRDEIQRGYIKAILSQYPKSGSTTHLRSFQLSWFKLFPSWLQYSPTKDAAFCLPCFLFYKPCGSGYDGQQAFTVDGFQNWKKVRDGAKWAFLNHIGKYPNSFHNVAERSCEDWMNQFQHIQKVLDNFTSKQIVDNRLRLKVSIDTIRLLAFRGCVFRGRDERPNSINRGNFLQIVKLLGSYNDNVAKVLDKAPKNASYTSPKIQKEILHIFSTKVKNAIREEIGDAKYCIIVDEARDESKNEKMAIVLRFIDKDGFVREHFFGLIHVSNTAASTLKDGIYFVLSHHNLDIQNIREQGHDGASNMRDEWKGLQALVLNDCPYAYYIHCFAHRLQLALMAASKDVIPIHKFFPKLTFVINIVGVSCKRNDELKVAQAAEIEHIIDIDKLETRMGLNQIGTLQ
ncbi:uncharacterized protein LOC114305656 [Camellia sinensis]|uniref:uncharacterized protein LOC114305656 n=1 Tax=Camellia sinensis TaxID=4442 RepID=UPI001035A288|nr:uncharacterized protein LOC114305656 [Camellia sinensis]